MNLDMMRMWAEKNRQQYEHEQLKKALSDRKEHEEKLLRMVEGGLITRDEWREMMGMKILKGNAEIDQLKNELKNMGREETPTIPKVLNCPNCGAPITGNKCEYCGTIFNDQPKPEKKKFIADGVIYYEYDPKDMSTKVFDNKGEQVAKINDEDLIREFGYSHHKMSLGEFQEALKYLVATRRESS